MSPIDFQLLSDREQDAQACLVEASERYFDGRTDAAFALLPQSNHPDYLMGYISYYNEDYKLNGEQNPNSRPITICSEEF